MYLHVGVHIVSDALFEKSVLGTKVLGNVVLERTTNFVWPAVQQERDLCVYFLSSPFLLLPNFSDLYMTYRIGNQSFNQYRTFGKHGVYHHIS